MPSIIYSLPPLPNFAPIPKIGNIYIYICIYTYIYIYTITSQAYTNPENSSSRKQHSIFLEKQPFFLVPEVAGIYGIPTMFVFPKNRSDSPRDGAGTCFAVTCFAGGACGAT